MHYRRLGRSGLKVSEISLGAWVTFGSQLQEQSAVNLFHAAYDQGINFFDNADMYADGQAEIVMGKAMAGLPRQALVISSKVFFPTFPGPNGKGLSRKHIIDSVHATLKRLDTDYLDLYFCHRFDPDSPMEEVVRTMTDLVSQGKIMYWGTSKWSGSQITSAIAVARQYNGIPPTVEQCRYNMLDRRSVEVDLSYAVKEYGLGLTSFSPLGYGILSGKYNSGIPEGSRAAIPEMAWIKDRITPEAIGKVRGVGVVAAELGLTPAQLAIAWILRRKEVSSVITGASRLEQLDENIQAGDAVSKLTDDILETIEKILNNHPEEE
jgi:voltage-dependent potassium channel beta subunit